MKDRDGALLFKQEYIAGRVIETTDIDDSKIWLLEFSMLGGPSHSFTFYDELEAKAAYKTIETELLNYCRTWFEKMVETHDEMTPAPEYTPLKKEP